MPYHPASVVALVEVLNETESRHLQTLCFEKGIFWSDRVANFLDLKEYPTCILLQKYSRRLTNQSGTFLLYARRSFWEGQRQPLNIITLPMFEKWVYPNLGEGGDTE